jgi:hypothetical protein
MSHHIKKTVLLAIKRNSMSKNVELTTIAILLMDRM